MHAGHIPIHKYLKKKTLKMEKRESFITHFLKMHVITFTDIYRENTCILKSNHMKGPCLLLLQYHKNTYN